MRSCGSCKYYANIRIGGLCERFDHRVSPDTSAVKCQEFKSLKFVRTAKTKEFMES